MRAKSSFTLSALLLFSTAQAGPLTHYIQYQLDNPKNYLASPSIKTAYFTQLIDHDNPAKGTFQQRYYIDNSFGNRPTSPVFFYICGEAACTSNALMGAIRTYAKEHHARLVALEHRYYGKSLPYPSFSTTALANLSTDEAINDLARFQQQISEEKHWTGTWISFGGSYPGSLSAYYRLRHPELVAGALASSAPVMAKEDFIEYDEHVGKVLPVQCANKVRETVYQIEQSLSKPAELKKVQSLFSAQDIKEPVDFLYLVADVAASAVQYGMQNRFCAMLNSTQEPINGYAAFAKQLFIDYQINPIDFSPEGAMSENPADYANGVGMRQWYYQSCREYGYWQNAHPDASRSTRSSLINLDYHHHLCQRLFGNIDPVDTNHINNQYYYPLISTASVSNIYFTNGSNDPWSNLSITEKNGNADNKNLSYDLIQGAAHCDDLRNPRDSDSAQLKAVRQRTSALIKKWLGA